MLYKNTYSHLTSWVEIQRSTLYKNTYSHLTSWVEIQRSMLYKNTYSHLTSWVEIQRSTLYKNTYSHLTSWVEIQRSTLYKNTYSHLTSWVEIQRSMLYKNTYSHIKSLLQSVGVSPIDELVLMWHIPTELSSAQSQSQLDTDLAERWLLTHHFLQPQGPSPQSFTPLREVGFIAWHLRHP